MTKVPPITASKAIKAFGKAGFVEVRQSGSHRILKKDGHRFLLSIPDHRGKTVGNSLLISQIEAAGLTRDEFLAGC